MWLHLHLDMNPQYERCSANILDSMMPVRVKKGRYPSANGSALHNALRYTQQLSLERTGDRSSIERRSRAWSL